MDFLLLADVDANTLLTRKEGQLFDRKSIRIKPAQLADAIIALANADGGCNWNTR